MTVINSEKKYEIREVKKKNEKNSPTTTKTLTRKLTEKKTGFAIKHNTLFVFISYTTLICTNTVKGKFEARDESAHILMKRMQAMSVTHGIDNQFL